MNATHSVVNDAIQQVFRRWANDIDRDALEHMSAFSSLRVWDGDNYYSCPRSYNSITKVTFFVCGKCRDSELKYPGDVCEFCWCVAVGEQKIGDTINVKRPMRFA